jgi:DNA-binding HxlR family transcriptional regulator
VTLPKGAESERSGRELDRQVVEAIRALTDPARLRVAGRLAAGPHTGGELANATELSRPATERALATLERAGLARRDGDRWSLEVERLALVSRTLAELDGALEDETPPVVGPDGRRLSPEESKTIRSFIVGGRLATIPSTDRKRGVVLRWLLDAVFTEDRDYAEAEVNQRLGLFHPDVAALRRYMVDAGLVRRDHGLYRRERVPVETAPTS